MPEVLEPADGIRILVGDVRETLRTLPGESADCVVTSPPYWGLRDYGTAAWEGGDAECDHRLPSVRTHNMDKLGKRYHGGGRKASTEGTTLTQYADACGTCGARRVDSQIGLEATPNEYVAALVDVFREVRRVLADHGTVWLNLGDSYAGGKTGRSDGDRHDVDGFHGGRKWEGEPSRQRKPPPGLKPKDLCGIPWRVALALQADGWWLRCDVIWAKTRAMPESTTDRPSKAHEYIFLLTKRPHYYFDQEAVREPLAEGSLARAGRASYLADPEAAAQVPYAMQNAPVASPAGRNIRSVWEICPAGYPGAHFATFPEELPHRCILAGCPEHVCRLCGKPRERIVERLDAEEFAERQAARVEAGAYEGDGMAVGARAQQPARGSGGSRDLLPPVNRTLGWTDCGHDDYRPGVVLDPFNGSGTTAVVARRLNREAIGCELRPEYAQLAVERCARWWAPPARPQDVDPDQLTLLESKA